MSYLSDYKTRILSNGNGIKATNENASKSAFIDVFDDISGNETIYIDGIATKVILINGKDSTYQIVQFLPSTTVSIGEIVTIGTKYWLVTDFVPNPISPKASIQFCNDTIKWQNASGFKYSIPCVATRSLLTKMDIKESSYNVSLLAGEMNVFVPNNEITETIKADQRFYLGNQIYNVTGIDDISNIGIIRFAMKTTTKSENDNDDERICDYISGTHSVVINNGATGSFGIGQEIQIEVDVLFGDKLITDPEIIYTNANNEVATIDANGLLTTIGLGTTIVTATAYGASDTMAITITDEVVTDNYLIIISGKEELPYGATEIYTAVVTNNGVPDETKVVIFSITSGNDYANILSFTDLTCTLQNIAIGTLVLKAEFIDGKDTINDTKTILCRGMW